MHGSLESHRSLHELVKLFHIWKSIEGGYHGLWKHYALNFGTLGSRCLFHQERRATVGASDSGGRQYTVVDIEGIVCSDAYCRCRIPKVRFDGCLYEGLTWFPWRILGKVVGTRSCSAKLMAIWVTVSAGNGHWWVREIMVVSFAASGEAAHRVLCSS